MLRSNSFYTETYYAESVIDDTFSDFLIRAKKSTYANSTIEKVKSSDAQTIKNSDTSKLLES